MPLDFPSNPTNGQTYDNYYWDASSNAWRSSGTKAGLQPRVTALELAGATTNKSGLVPIVPPTINIVSGTGSINSAGKVSFSNATSVELLNVFSSAYDTYRIIFQGTRGGAISIEYLHMRVGSYSGVFTSANYAGGFNGIESGYTATMNITNASAGTFALGSIANAGQYFSGEALLANPYLADRTHIVSQMLGFQQGNAQGYNYSAGYQSDATSFPSIGLFSSGSKPITGTIQVFGYKNS